MPKRYFNNTITTVHIKLLGKHCLKSGEMFHRYSIRFSWHKTMEYAYISLGFSYIAFRNLYRAMNAMKNLKKKLFKPYKIPTKNYATFHSVSLICFIGITIII